MRSLVASGRTRSWEAHQLGQQFADNESKDTGNSQTQQLEGNARFNQISAMRPRFVKTFQKVGTASYFDSPETDLHYAANTYCLDYTKTQPLKQFHSLSDTQSPHYSTTNYRCEYTLEPNTGVAWLGPRIMWIHMIIALKWKIELMLAAVHNSVRMDHCTVSHGSVEVLLTLGSMDSKHAYSHMASRYQATWYLITCTP
jgi:hypothetical protein